MYTSKSQQRRYVSRSNAAFSILELLLVLVILAILAGIVGMRFTGQSKKSKITAAESQLSNFSNALATFEIRTACQFQFSDSLQCHATVKIVSVLRCGNRLPVRALQHQSRRRNSGAVLQ